MTSESYHLELEIFATHMGGEDGSLSGGTIDVMRPSARVFIELQEDPRVFSIRFNHDFWAGGCVRPSLHGGYV